MTQRRPQSDDADLPTLAPREEAALEEAVRPVASRGRGFTIATALIVLAFMVGLVRPWDLFTGTGEGAATGPDASRAAVPPSGGQDLPPATGTTNPDGSGIPGIGMDDPASPTCGYPTAWWSATIQTWAGRRARVWSAVDAQAATGPTDPVIEFQVVAGDDFTAIGWCAPVAGDERPPIGARGHLFGIDVDGGAVELPYERLEPATASALGELWAPTSEPDNGWALGQYVIALTTPDGSWARYLGLDLRTSPAGPSPAPGTPSPPPTPSGPPPTASPVSSAPTPGQTD
jgi:hypothetical protein